MRDVAVDGDVVCDHVWFKVGKRLAGLRAGDVIQFDARVKTYVKGYRGRDPLRRIENPPRRDWHLAWPTRVRVVERVDVSEGREV